MFEVLSDGGREGGRIDCRREEDTRCEKAACAFLERELQRRGGGESMWKGGRGPDEVLLL